MILMNPSRRIARDLRACLVAGPILLLMWARETQRANPIEFALPRLRFRVALFIHSTPSRNYASLYVQSRVPATTW